MKNKVEKLSIAFALAFTIASCGSDDDNPTSENHKPVVLEVSITGDDFTVGQELTASAKFDDEDGDDVILKYQWYRSADNELKKEGDDKDTAIKGATESTYKLVEDDVNHFIFVEVTPNDDEVDGEPLLSKPTSDKVKAANKKPVIAAGGVSIDGTLTVGSDLTANASATDEDGEDSKITYTYQWYRSVDNKLEKEGDSPDTAIEGATESTYKLVEDDKGNFIIVEVTPKDDKKLEGDAVTGVTSNAIPN